MVVAHKWAQAQGHLRPLAFATALTITLQLGGQGLFGLNFARYVFSHETRDDFLSRNVPGYAPIPWINTHLGPYDRIFLIQRWLNYLIDVPIYYGHDVQDALVDLRPKAKDPVAFYRQIQAQGVTHLLVIEESSGDPSAGLNVWRGLLSMGCLEPIHSVAARMFGSRTLHDIEAEVTERVYRLKGPACLR